MRVTSAVPHISVCICTYRRPELLRRLLSELSNQETAGLFTYSIVVADNDASESAKPMVEEIVRTNPVKITYCVQPRQNIALARNTALSYAKGDFIAFIDDDELPIRDWLVALFKTCNVYQVDGVIGTVKPRFQTQPPKWVVKGRFCEREAYKTGSVIKWQQGRTGNLLFKREVLDLIDEPFRPQFLTAEDQDFFRRLIQNGCVFVWCDEAVAYEQVPPSRWNCSCMLRRALLRGEISLNHPTSRLYGFLKSVVALPIYLLALPFLIPFGQHVFISYLVRSFDHAGRILAFLKISPTSRHYVTE